MARVFFRWMMAAAIAVGALASFAPSDARAEGPWNAVRNKRALGGSTLQTAVTGAVAAFDVQARTFSVWYLAGPKNGRLALYLNGAPYKVIDQWAPSQTPKPFVVRSSRPVNTVMFVALGTKRAKSKGTLVNVDAISPQRDRCAKGCLRTPIAAFVLNSLSEIAADPVWYPDVVPTADQPRFNVAIGSYVRGQDVLPLEANEPLIREAMCMKARTVPQGVVILSFGRQIAGGTSGFGTALTSADIAATTSIVASALAQCASGPWEVAIGTSNSGGVTPFNGFDGGVVWAQTVEQARAMSDLRVAISGAVDIEPSWGPVRQAKAWVSGFTSVSGRRLWNFGSADGCPQSVGGRRCNNGWTIDDVVWVSTQASPSIVVIPQIHTQSGSQARQWAVIAARSLELGAPLRIAGVGAQTTACQQVREGCRTTNNDAWTAWSQLRQALDVIPSTAGMAIGPPRDIRWSWR